MRSFLASQWWLNQALTLYMHCPDSINFKDCNIISRDRSHLQHIEVQTDSHVLLINDILQYKAILTSGLTWFINTWAFFYRTNFRSLVASSVGDRYMSDASVVYRCIDAWDYVYSLREPCNMFVSTLYDLLYSQRAILVSHSRHTKPHQMLSC